MTFSFARIAVSAAVIGMAGTAFAQDGNGPAGEPVRQYVLDLGIGGIVKPKYAAADSYLLYPFPIINVGNFYIPGLGQVKDGRRTEGVFFYPSFNFNGEREASDDPGLRGTNTIDWALELGLGGGYRTENWRVFAELRQGFNGHSGQVGQLGFDGIFYPTDKLEVSVGPRADFAFGDYMDTYFGVTAAEAAASGGRLTRYDPGSGFTSVGLAARGSYNITDNVRFHVQAGYDRLVGDAADSPIASVGSKDQFSIGAGFSYRFAFDLFN